MFKVINYWLCSYLRKVKSNKSPELTATLSISLSQSCNVFTLFIIIRHYFNIHFSNNDIQLYGLSILVIIAIINHLVLLRKSVREAFFKRYESSSDKKKERDKFIFWIYMVVSVPLFFVALYYVKPYVN